MSDQPAIKYKRHPCPRCGAATVREAETMCRPTQDQSGEYDCPGGDTEDEQGYIRQPTPESIAALDVWIDAEAKRMGW